MTGSIITVSTTDHAMTSVEANDDSACRECRQRLRGLQRGCLAMDRGATGYQRDTNGQIVGVFDTNFEEKRT